VVADVSALLEYGLEPGQLVADVLAWPEYDLALGLEPARLVADVLAWPEYGLALGLEPAQLVADVLAWPEYGLALGQHKSLAPMEQFRGALACRLALQKDDGWTEDCCSSAANPLCLLRSELLHCPWAYSEWE